MLYSLTLYRAICQLYLNKLKQISESSKKLQYCIVHLNSYLSMKLKRHLQHVEKREMSGDVGLGPHYGSFEIERVAVV